ncbi:TonB-dependent receptor [Azotobacter beijerinckii]|uniref:Outer membrane cobalamin receptor protein n=1 Tax=Azotobacter beijerinckii TaxID=170623 RepID=A0A1I1BCH3_9GAMM|nr:TonB-dependent receptor plug domain-containing protein [Azotobacter beijerinckii]SFB48065.1 Outer membrane cobalamin receptor protein [Azotobacter beijerinckii]
MARMKAPCLLLSPILLLPDGAAWAVDEVRLSPLQVEGSQDEMIGEPVGAAIPAYQRFALPRSVAAVQTLEREDIEAIRPRDVSDLIEGSLGMSIGRQGARVHNFSYNRGDKVSIILDGVYLTQAEAQRVLGDLPVEMIDSIRFLRDASVITISPLMDFGSANAGSPNQGFILIETRKSGPGKEGGELKTSYASYDTRKTLGFLGDTWLDGRLSLGGGYQRSESNGKPKWNMAYAADTWLANAGWKDECFIASASFFLNKASREIQRAEGTYTGATRYPLSGPTPKGVMDKNIWKYAPMDTRVIAVNLTRPWNDVHTTALTYGWTEAKGTQYAYTTTTDKSTVAGRDAKDRAKEWNLSHTVAGAKTTFKIGAQTVEWFQLSEGNSSPREEKVYGAYITLEQRITPAWSVDAAFRLDRKRIIQGGDKYLENGSKTELSDGQWTDDATLFSLGSAWQIDPVWRLSGRYSFNRTPTPDVITTRNNESLPAEKRHRYELGLNAHFGRALQLSLTPFYYVLRNAKVSDGAIDTDAEGNPIIDPTTGEQTSVSIYKAVDEVIRKGIEVGLQGNAGAWSYELGWTYYDGNDENGTTGSEVPDNKYNARLGWRQGPWNASLSAVRVDPYLSYGYTVGDFTVLNLNLSRELGHSFSASLFAQNLLDERYATNNKGYPATANWGVLRDVGTTYGTEMRFRF